MARLEAEVLSLLFDRRWRANPYPLYRHLREESPVHITPFGLVLVARHTDVQSGLRDPALSSDLGHVVGNASALGPTSPTETVRTAIRTIRYGRLDLVRHRSILVAALRRQDAGESLTFGSLVRRTLLFRDPPEHTRLRGLVNRAFTPRTIERLQSRVEAFVTELLGRQPKDRPFDLMTEFAYPLPLRIICELLGVPTTDTDQLINWSRQLALGLDPVAGLTDPTAIRRADNAAAALTAYLGQLLADRRRRPQADLLSTLADAEANGDTLSNDDIVVTAALLLIAGHETTVNLITTGLLTLLEHPDAMHTWSTTGDITDTAVEELLRYEAPVQTVSRVATQSTTIADTDIPAGTIVMFLIGSANRDPDEFDNPDHLDLTRQPNRHIGFGNGIHYCLGAALARAEARVALPALLARHPRLTESATNLSWRPGLAIRGLEEFPISFTT